MEVRSRRSLQEERSCFCQGSHPTSPQSAHLTPTKKTKLAKRCLTNITICVLLVGYTFVGAVVFLAVEGGDGGGVVVAPDPGPEAQGVRANGSWLGEDARQRAVENIWEITVSLNILYKENWTRLAGLEIARFQEVLVKRISEEMAYTDELRTHKAPLPPEWTLAKAFLYSLTLLTTIGYGSMSPRTGLGKAVTMGYAAVGIPLVLLYLSSIGSLMSACARNVFTRSLCCCLCSNCGYCCYDEKRMEEKERRMKKKRERKELEEQMKREEGFYVRPGGAYPGDLLEGVDSVSDASLPDTRTAATFVAPLLLCLTVMVLYIGGGAAILCRLDPTWTYLDSVFFCFLVLSTIGYGDSIPSDSVLSAHSRNRSHLSQLTLWFCSAYILCGLAFTAMSFHVVYDHILHRLRHNYFIVENIKNKTNYTVSTLKLASGKFIEEASSGNSYLPPS